jgi:hypothetical protein
VPVVISVNIRVTARARKAASMLVRCNESNVAPLAKLNQRTLLSCDASILPEASDIPLAGFDVRDLSDDATPIDASPRVSYNKVRAGLC